MASIEKKDNNIVVISLEASQEEFKDAMMKSFNKNKNRFQIPGFRKGKAPFKLVTQYYGEGVLYDDAIDFVVNPAYQA
ncbi:MAG: trigger factor family protein, partial [Erysipelotrichaceae bacterium]|nr:trigger factor family protein [Erysipelotrichaceae bacterium]